MLPLIGLALQAAPLIARWIGGDKAAGVVEEVGKVAASVFGTTDPKEIEKKIAEDRALYVQWQLGLATLVDEKEKRAHEATMAEFANTYDARGMYDNSKTITDKLAWITVFAFFAINSLAAYGLYLLLINGIKVNGNVEIWLTVSTLFGTMIGWINSKTDMVFNFFFGSSRGSDTKGEQVGNALNKLIKWRSK